MKRRYIYFGLLKIPNRTCTNIDLLNKGYFCFRIYIFKYFSILKQLKTNQNFVMTVSQPTGSPQQQKTAAAFFAKKKKNCSIINQQSPSRQMPVNSPDTCRLMDFPGRQTNFGSILAHCPPVPPPPVLKRMMELKEGVGGTPGAMGKVRVYLRVLTKGKNNLSAL